MKQSHCFCRESKKKDLVRTEKLKLAYTNQKGNGKAIYFFWEYYIKARFSLKDSL